MIQQIGNVRRTEKTNFSTKNVAGKFLSNPFLSKFLLKSTKKGLVFCRFQQKNFRQIFRQKLMSSSRSLRRRLQMGGGAGTYPPPPASENVHAPPSSIQNSGSAQWEVPEASFDPILSDLKGLAKKTQDEGKEASEKKATIRNYASVPLQRL